MNGWRRVSRAVRGASVEVLCWPTLDPSGIGENCEQKLAAYRQTRDQIMQRIAASFRA